MITHRNKSVALLIRVRNLAPYGAVIFLIATGLTQIGVSILGARGMPRRHRNRSRDFRINQEVGRSGCGDSHLSTGDTPAERTG